MELDSKSVYYDPSIYSANLFYLQPQLNYPTNLLQMALPEGKLSGGEGADQLDKWQIHV